MHIYTILLDYAGGTYIAQTRATDERAAVRDWLEMLKLERAAGAISEEVAASFDGGVAEPTPLDGLTSTWCVTASASQGLALVNIVKTAS